MDLSVISDVVRDQEIFSLRESDTAHLAAQMMVEHDISAIIVVDESGLLIGIVTERDITRRMAAADLQPRDTRLADLMTRKVDTILPEDSPFYALRLMLDRRYRHLPVVEEKRVVGMVSIRDLRLIVTTASTRRRKHPLWGALGFSR